MYSAKQAWCQAYQMSDSVDQHHSKAALIGYLCLVEIWPAVPNQPEQSIQCGPSCPLLLRHWSQSKGE